MRGPQRLLPVRKESRGMNDGFDNSIHFVTLF